MAVETRIMNCIMCPLGCEMTVTIEDGADRADRKPQKDAATGSGNSNVDNARTGIGHKGAVGRVFREK